MYFKKGNQAQNEKVKERFKAILLFFILLFLMLSSHVVIAIFQNQIKSLKKSMTMMTLKSWVHTKLISFYFLSVKCERYY